ncbi:MAG: trypsin-like peptidase domain-containing protein [Planctomycetota bacterium]
MKRPLALAVAAVLVLCAGVTIAAEPDSLRRTPVVKAIERAGPAVVNISTTKLLGSAFYQDWFGRWRARRPVKSVGSGVIVHPDGYVVTNSHVVKQATEILVGLGGNGQEQSYRAVLVAHNEANDIAVLKIAREKPFPAVHLGRSDDLMIGEPTIAVGNPFGVGKTVTTGILSAVGRKVDVSSEVSFVDFLQTDAAINPGNSGGALLNIHGDMIGLNTAIIRGGDGIGFAIPVDRVKAIVAMLIDEALAIRDLGLTGEAGTEGIRVETVEKGRVADGAGIEPGDRIVAVDGRVAKSIFDLASPILTAAPGSKVTLTVSRDGGKETLALTTAEEPYLAYVQRRLGLTGKDLPEDTTKRGGYGVVVVSVTPKSPSERIQMKGGDLVISFAGEPVKNIAALASLVYRAEAGKAVSLEVVRERRRMGGDIIPR